MTLLTPEGIARHIQTLYETYYNASLDTVEATWAATEAVTLSDFVDRRIVADPSYIGNFTQFPALAIGVGDMREDVSGDQRVQLYNNFYLLDVQVAYYLKALDMHTLALMLTRHMEATLLFLFDHPRLDYGNDVTIRNLRLEPAANVFDSGGNTLVKGLRIRFDVRFMQRGF